MIRIAVAQVLTRAVDCVGQLRGKPSVGSRIVPPSASGCPALRKSLSQAPRTAPAEQQTACSCHTQQQRQRGQHTRCHGVHKLLIVVNIVLPDRTARQGDHEQAVSLPSSRTPASRQDTIARTRRFRSLRSVYSSSGQVMLPNHTAVVVQRHRPGVALQPVRGRAAAGSSCRPSAEGSGASASVPMRTRLSAAVAVVQPQIDHRPQQQTHHQEPTAAVAST